MAAWKQKWKTTGVVLLEVVVPDERTLLCTRNHDDYKTTQAQILYIYICESTIWNDEKIERRE